MAAARTAGHPASSDFCNPVFRRWHSNARRRACVCSAVSKFFSSCATIYRLSESRAERRHSVRLAHHGRIGCRDPKVWHCGLCGCVLGCSHRYTGCGLRAAACGLRLAACGLRLAACGLRLAACGNGRTPRAAPSLRAAQVDNGLAAQHIGRRQAAGGRRQAAGGRRQAAGGRRQAADRNWTSLTSGSSRPAACSNTAARA